MNILFIIAHPDDEVLGCGGTLRKLADEGHDIYTCVLCAPADARHERPDLKSFQEAVEEAEKVIGIKDSIKYEFKNIQFNTVPHLEMVKAIEAAIVKFKPEWIFTHHPSDVNIDHRICYEASMAAVRLPQRFSKDMSPTLIKKIFLFEVLSSTDWSPPIGLAFQPNCFFDVKKTFDNKMQALGYYGNALKPFPHSRSRENIKALANLRGAEVGIEMAEAFCLIRDLNL
ncbi:MAG: PIG-L family deacetylase [Candidatus Methylumidiphilus sp.]